MSPVGVRRRSRGEASLRQEKEHRKLGGWEAFSYYSAGPPGPGTRDPSLRIESSVAGGCQALQECEGNRPSARHGKHRSSAAGRAAFVYSHGGEPAGRPGAAGLRAAACA